MPGSARERLCAGVVVLSMNSWTPETGTRIQRPTWTTGNAPRAMSRRTVRVEMPPSCRPTSSSDQSSSAASAIGAQGFMVVRPSAKIPMPRQDFKREQRCAHKPSSNIPKTGAGRWVDLPVSLGDLFGKFCRCVTRWRRSAVLFSDRPPIPINRFADAVAYSPIFNEAQRSTATKEPNTGASHCCIPNSKLTSAIESSDH